MPHAKLKVLEERVSKVGSTLKSYKGSAPHSNDYFRGVLNGLEIANGILHDKEPNLIAAPGEPVDASKLVPQSAGKSSAPESPVAPSPSAPPVSEKPKKEKKPKKPAESSGASETPPAV